MLKRLPAALAALMVLTLCVHAEETKPPYEIKVEGEKLENVKITVLENTPPDRSSARAIVESYNRYLSFISDLFFADKHQEFKERMEKLSYDAERSVNEKLFTGGCLDAMKAAKDKQDVERKEREAKDAAEGKPPYRRVPPKVTGEKVDGESAIVDVEETSEWSTKNKDGKWETTSSVKHIRYVCASKEGAWSIDRCEKEENDYNAKPNDKGEYPKIWKEDKIVAGFISFFAQDFKTSPMPEIDTPEKLARAAMTWLNGARRANSNTLALDFFNQLTDKIKPMFSEHHVKDAEDEAAKRGKEEAERREKEMKEKAERKITSKALEDGSFEVTIAARNEWSAEIRLIVIKTEAGLRISQASLCRMETSYKDGKAEKTEKIEPMTSPNEMDWN